VVKAAVAAIPEKLPAGPFQPTWESLKAKLQGAAVVSGGEVRDIHALGSVHGAGVPGRGRVGMVHHTPIQRRGDADDAYAEYGPLTTFGYKDFIPLFTCEKYDPEAWALLFKKAGAKFVVPTAQHR